MTSASCSTGRLLSAAKRDRSYDDLDIIDDRPAPKFRYAQPRPVPKSVPTSLPSQNAPRDDAPGSPLRDSKGKGRAPPKVEVVTPDCPSTSEVPDSLLKRLAGPSTGKAGLKRDPEEVQRIIYEASKGSKFFFNEQKRDESTSAQVNRMLKHLEAKLESRNGDVSAEERIVEQLAKTLESERIVDQTVVVCDADAFYASVEELDDPRLVGKAFGVGGGVLTTASYEARKYGVRSAMAGYVAKKLCPHLIFVKPDFSKYGEASKKIMAILRRYDPNMRPASLDEAYLNITQFLKDTGRQASDVVSEMRACVKAETGLTISAGIAPVNFVAKIAADVRKPDGQCLVLNDRESVMKFLAPLSVRKIPGVGRVTERWLEALEVRTISDIWKYRGKLMLNHSIDQDARWLLRAYLGLGSSHVAPSERGDRKSVGCESTFGTMWKWGDLDDKLHSIAESLASDMERLQYSGRTISLKLKLDTYEVLSRAHTISSNVYLRTSEDLYKIGRSLLDKEIASRHSIYDSGQKPKGCGGARDLRIRLLGLRFTNLRDESEAARRSVGGASGIEQWTKSKPGIGDPVDEAVDELAGEGEWHTDLLEAGGEGVEPVRLSKADGIRDAECPICSRTWTEVSQSALELHVESCIENSSKPKKSSSKANASVEAKPKDAFAALMRSRR